MTLSNISKIMPSVRNAGLVGAEATYEKESCQF